MADPALGYRFRVEIDGLDLSFTKVEGLGAKYDMLEVKEGGENGYVHKLPGRLSYDDIKLTRPVDDKSKALAAWFTAHQKGMSSLGVGKLANATISAVDGQDNTIAAWTLTGVFPYKYSGPSFKTGSTEVITETLTLCHQGFFGDFASGVGAAEMVV